MSYRLIDSNAIAIKYPEVNDMPCVFADLPDGMNGQFIDAQPERKTGYWVNTDPNYKDGFYNNAHYCSECKDYYTTSPSEMHYCPNCGAKMEEEFDEQ